jgi:hypothetical protein
MRKLTHKLILVTAVATRLVVGTDVNDGAYVSANSKNFGKNGVDFSLAKTF